MKDRTRKNLGMVFMILGVFSLLAGLTALPSIYVFLVENIRGNLILSIRALAGAILLLTGYTLIRLGYPWFIQKGWLLVKCMKCGKIVRKPNYWPKKEFKPGEMIVGGFVIPPPVHRCKHHQILPGNVTFVSYE